MTCLVADGLDEVIVRSTMESRGLLAEATDTGSDREAATSPPRGVVDTSTAADREENGEKGIDGESTSPSGSLARALALTLGSTEELSPLDVEAIESAVRAAKRERLKSRSKAAEEEEKDRQRRKEEEEATRAERVRRAARAFRAAINKISVDEHEGRYEIVHEEINKYKSILSNHKASLAVVRKTSLTGQQHERMILERRCTLELLKIVLLWQSQHEQIMELYWGRRAILLRVAEGRRALEASELTARAIIAEYGLVLSRQLLREASENAARLKPLQLHYEAERAAEIRKAQEARQYEAALAERERLIRDHQEVERLLRQKGAVRAAQRESLESEDYAEDFPFEA